MQLLSLSGANSDPPKRPASRSGLDSLLLGRHAEFLRDEFGLTFWERVQLFAQFRVRAVRRKLICTLGGYDQVAVEKLLFNSRRLCQELESYDGRILRLLQRRQKLYIAEVDPQLGQLYGYGK